MGWMTVISRCSLIIRLSRATCGRTARNKVTAMTTTKTSHVERTAEEPRDKNLYKVTLSRVVQINEKVRLFRLDLPHQGAKFLPGQWLDTYVPSNPKAGGFTITSSPSRALPSGDSKPYLELAVQESPSNPPAEFLFRPVESILGSTLQVRIGGSFTFPPENIDMTSIKNVVFVAGGMGINPLMSILSYMAEHRQEGLEVRVLYSIKAPKEGNNGVLFLARIIRILQENLGGVLELFSTGSAGTVETPMNSQMKVQHRRMTFNDIETAVGLTPQDKISSLVYVCGPPAMTDEVVGFLTSKDGSNIDAKHVLTEKWW